MRISSSIITIFETDTIPVIDHDVYRGREIPGRLPIEQLIAFLATLPSVVSVERQHGVMTRLRLTDPECLPQVLRKWRLLIDSAVQEADRSAQLNRRLTEGEA